MADRSPCDRFTNQQLAEIITQQLKNITKEKLIAVLKENDKKKSPKRTSSSSHHSRIQVAIARAAPVYPRKGRIAIPPKVRPGPETEQQKLNDRLLFASKRGNKNEIEMLIAAGANVNVISYLGWTPLMLAVELGHKEIVKLLIAHGADPQKGKMVLMQAAQQSYREIVELLIREGANVSVTDKDECTILIWATREGYKEIVEILIRNGADTNAPDDKYGRTPLMYAAKYGSRECMEILIRNGVDINATDKKKWTPLMYAAKCGSQEGVEILIGTGADTEMKNYLGETARNFYLGNKKEFDRIIETVIDGKMVKAASNLNYN